MSLCVCVFVSVYMCVLGAGRRVRVERRFLQPKALELFPRSVLLGKMDFSLLYS